MQYELRIQDPTDPPRSVLFDELFALAEGGEVVGLRMFFGFLTGSGMDALLGVPAVKKILLHREVEVLVGLDAVTDRLGLERLLELAEENPRFKARVIKNTTGALVHPKMLVARYADGRGLAVVGSNNLSSGGLGGNVEGYAIARFDPGEDMDLSDWDAFIERWGALIAEIDNEALETAAQNARRLRRLRTAAAETTSVPGSHVVVSDGQVHETSALGVEDLGEVVLVAQIPRAGTRWPQVHYTAEIMRDYFEVEGGDHVFLRRFDGKNVEKRQVVYSRDSNKNHRIELGAAKEAGDYPADGRPVVLMRRESRSRRRHRYMLLMPGDVGHAEMTALAETTSKGPAHYVCRVIVPRSSVLAAWPECPL